MRALAHLLLLCAALVPSRTVSGQNTTAQDEAQNANPGLGGEGAAPQGNEPGLGRWGSSLVNYATPHCGKRLRIVTHHSPPFVMVNESFCTGGLGDEGKGGTCPPEAFGEDGGLTYRMVMEGVLPLLRRYCEDAGEDSRVELDWYLPPSNPTSSGNAMEMVCNGGMSPQAEEQRRDPATTLCPSSYNYRGPSGVDTCTSATDPTCASTGPDLTIGAIHILRERLEMLTFTPPYYVVEQALVKKAAAFNPRILTIFEAFTWEIWLLIGAEIIFVWLCILIVEGEKSPDLVEGAWYERTYDAFYWSFSSAFDPGAAGKTVHSLGGKVLMVGHWFFLVVIAATYTGTITAYLTSSADETVTGFDSLTGGKFSVIVQGPSWNNSVNPRNYMGKHEGGFGLPATAPSSQFEYLQALMRNSKKVHFSVFTMRSLDTFNADLEQLPAGVDPCLSQGAVLGGYDMLRCKGKKGAIQPDTLMMDAPEAIWALKQLRNEGGGVIQECPLLTVGPQFAPAGLGAAFPLNSPVEVPFSRALLESVELGVLHKYSKHYQIRAKDNVCQETAAITDAQAMELEFIAGIFFFTAGSVLLAIIHGLVERAWTGGRSAAEDRAQEEIKKLLDNPPEVVPGKPVKMMNDSQREMVRQLSIKKGGRAVSFRQLPLSGSFSRSLSMSFQASPAGPSPMAARLGSDASDGGGGRLPLGQRGQEADKVSQAERRIRKLIKKAKAIESRLRPLAQESLRPGVHDPRVAPEQSEAEPRRPRTLAALSVADSTEEPEPADFPDPYARAMEPADTTSTVLPSFVPSAMAQAMRMCSVNALSRMQVGAEDDATTTRPESLPTLFYSSRR